MFFFVLEDVGESSFNDSNWKGFALQPAAFQAYWCRRFVFCITFKSFGNMWSFKSCINCELFRELFLPFGSWVILPSIIRCPRIREELELCRHFCKDFHAEETIVLVWITESFEWRRFELERLYQIFMFFWQI